MPLSMRAAPAFHRGGGMLWFPPPDPVRLARDDVHLWRAALDLAPSAAEKLRRTLSPDELSRAARFRFPETQRRFTAARAILRDILARYIGREPARLEFGYQPRGKPFLAAGSGAAGLKFNLAHSHGMALCGITLGREVGVDLELVRPSLDHEKIAERFFSAAETAALRDLPPELRAESFFRCWARKEAYIKARGEGLAISLSSFAVSLAPGEPPALLSVRDDPSELERWTLVPLPPIAGYAAALAVEGRGLRLNLWDWQPSGRLAGGACVTAETRLRI
jgi:4'-phosphopantetheinyl transferase